MGGWLLLLVGHKEKGTGEGIEFYSLFMGNFLCLHRSSKLALIAPSLPTPVSGAAGRKMPGVRRQQLLQKLGSRSGEAGVGESRRGWLGWRLVGTWQRRGSSLFPKCVLRILSLGTYRERPGNRLVFLKMASFGGER